MIKPSIVSVITTRTPLHKSGKQYLGLCVLHPDKNPSLSVNEDKGVFFCHSCGASGDVIDFIMQLDGVNFPQALATLGISGTDIAHRQKNDSIKKTAVEISRWADTQTDRANSLLREIGQRLRLSEGINWTAEQQISEREFAILSDLADDLQNAKLVIELYKNRAHIEALLVDAEFEKPEPFPPLTPKYRAFLRSHLPKAATA